MGTEVPVGLGGKEKIRIPDLWLLFCLNFALGLWVSHFLSPGLRTFNRLAGAERFESACLFRWGCGGSYVLPSPFQGCSPGLGYGGHLGETPGGGHSKLSDLWEQLDSSAVADELAFLPTQERGHGILRRGIRLGDWMGRFVFSPWTDSIFALKSVCQPLFTGI